MKKIILALALSILVVLPSQAFVCRSTSYASGEDGNRYNAQGGLLREGQCAANTRYFPFGTKIKIDGRVYTVTDRGSAVTERNHIDIFCSSLRKMKERGTVICDAEVISSPNVSKRIKSEPKRSLVAKNTIPVRFNKSKSRSIVYSSKGHSDLPPFKQEEETEICMD